MVSEKVKTLRALSLGATVVEKHSQTEPGGNQLAIYNAIYNVRY